MSLGVTVRPEERLSSSKPVLSYAEGAVEGARLEGRWVVRDGLLQAQSLLTMNGFGELKLITR